MRPGREERADHRFFGRGSAQMTKKLVEQAGRKALLVAGDLRSEEFRKKVIEHHLEAFKFIGQSRSTPSFREGS